MAGVVRSVVDASRPMAAEHGLSIGADVAEGYRPRARADRDRLAQVLANLVENAAGFARRSVVVSLRPPAEGTGGPGPGGAAVGSVVVEVADDGPGIPVAEQHRVFERFHQVDHLPGRRLGSGVGLAIVAELVAAMRGTVGVVSPTLPGASGPGTLEHGTRMTVSLPAEL